MAPRLIRQGEGPAAAYLRAHEEQVEQKKRLARILVEVGEPAPRTKGGKGPGRMVGFRSSEDDLQRLRALPAVAPGVPGAIPHTDPVRELLRKERNGRRRP